MRGELPNIGNIRITLVAFVCLFVCLELFVPLDIVFFTHFETLPLPVKGCTF